jgi:putative toxin-antitoxin system antitoxin component (TIGR02293 family)
MTVQPVPKGRKTAKPRTLVQSVLTGGAPAPMDVFTAVGEGLPVADLELLIEYGLTLGEIGNAIGVSQRTLLRKRMQKARLDVAESDRVMRLATLLADADRYIGDHSKALAWLRTPNWSLGNRLPLDMLSVDAGVALVRQVLVSIAYGGVA